MRIKWIDQYKGFLALLVIIGHVLSWYCNIKDNSVFGVVYLLIYTFHMPAFFYLAGYLDKVSPSQFRNLHDFVNLVVNKRALKRAVNLIVPTIVSYVVLVFSLIVFAAMPLIDALLKVNYWYIWTLIAYGILHAICVNIIKKKEYLLVTLLVFVILTSNLNATISKFIGYFFCYILGAYIGTKGVSSRIANLLYKARYFLILVYLASVTFIYLEFSTDIAENPLYKCFLGSFMSFFLSILFSKYECKGYLLQAGKISLFLYLFQISIFLWIKYVIPGDNLIICCITLLLVSTVSFFFPIWVYKHFKDTTAYRLIFSPYQYIEKYLPSMRIKA